MAVYARQIDPSLQESPLFLFDECFPDNIAVCGNRYYKEHRPEVFDNVFTVLDSYELSKMLQNDEWNQWYKNITEAIKNYLPPIKGKYSTKDIGKLKQLIIQYENCRSYEENSILCAVLSIVTGQEWNYRTIRGCCQSDWNYVYYTVNEWDDKALKDFEVQYFNTGSEWMIDDEGFDPENNNPTEICGYTIYCTSWNEEGIRKEIANAAGVNLAYVILYYFDGYEKTPKYYCKKYE